MQNKDAALTIVAGQEGTTLSVIGDTYRLVLTGDQTENALAVIDMLIPPNGGPGPHAHAACQESFYVLDGEVVVKTNAQTYTAKKGSFISIPLGGVVHDFKNETSTTAHLLCIVVPAGLDKMFQEMGKPVQAGTFLPPPEMTPEYLKQMTAIAKKYGQEPFPPDYFDK